MGKPESEQAEYTRFLQRSAEARMRAIQEKLSITNTFCSTVQIELRFGDPGRAMGLLRKLRSTIDELTAHIHNSAHVSDKHYKTEFRKQLAHLKGRLDQLDSQIKQRN